MRWLALICLAGAAGAQPLPTLPVAEDRAPEPGVVHVRLEAAALPDPQHGFVYGFNGASPGPTIRARRGDTLVVELVNGLDTATTLHWHGLHVPFAMDGVAWMLDPVAPGETFTYQFALEQSGTYWYHPHFDTARQVDGGLFGVVVVEDPGEPAPPDQVWIADLPLEHDPTDARPGHGRARLSPAWWINGAPTPLTWAPPAGQAQRVRILNASSTGYLALPPLPGLRRIAGDQGLLAAAETAGPWVLAPGDRVDFEYRPAAPATWITEAYSLNGGARWGDPWPLVEVSPAGAAADEPPLAWPFDGAAPSPDRPADLFYVLTGSDRTGQWFINGEQFPEVTIHELALGADVVIEVRNVSPTHHPFHIHGHAFEVLSVDGAPPASRRVEDTLDVGIRQAVRLRLVADNPGDWMTHCHILPHAEEGMMTVLRVDAQ